LVALGALVTPRSFAQPSQVAVDGTQAQFPESASWETPVERLASMGILDPRPTEPNDPRLQSIFESLQAEAARKAGVDCGGGATQLTPWSNSVVWPQPWSVVFKSAAAFACES